MFSFLGFIVGICIYLSFFDKKLISLLALELMMISLIYYFFLSSSSFGMKSSFLSFILLCFMVLDSTLGITLLVSSTRSSFYSGNRNLF